MITEQQVQKAIDYLTKTDEPCAKAKARMKVSEQLRKTSEATAFLKATGSGVVRKQEAYASQEFIEATNEIYNATMDFEIMANKRKRAELTIDVWRSLNANQRRGNI